MARVTVEDCLAHVPNRFALTILASRRARALGENRGRPLIECENKEGVTALREISAEKVRFKEDVEAALFDFIEEQRRQLRVTTGEHTFLEAASLRALEEEDLDEDEVVDEEIEELDTDPELLGKQAKGEVEEEEAVVEDEEEEVEEAADEFEADAPFDDEDIPDPEEEEDASDDAEEEPAEEED